MKLLLSAIFVLISVTSQAEDTFGDFSGEQVCKAGIATNNGRSAKGIFALEQQGTIISVAYTRDDGKIFGYYCEIKGKEIFWRSQSMSNWSKNIKLYFSLTESGSKLDIQSVVFGDPIRKSFRKEDF